MITSNYGDFFINGLVILYDVTCPFKKSLMLMRLFSKSRWHGYRTVPACTANSPCRSEQVTIISEAMASSNVNCWEQFQGHFRGKCMTENEK